MEKNVSIIDSRYTGSIYMENIPSFDHLNLLTCVDLDINRAQVQEEKHHIKHAYTVGQLLHDQDIDLMINLTILKAHAIICN